MGSCMIVKLFLFGFKVALTQSNELLLPSVYFDSFMNMPKHWSSGVVASGNLRSRIIQILVSFFGASHINMPLQEAKLSTNIRLKFRTRQVNAMIFLTAGRTDHCLLTLNDGRIKFQLKINEYETEVREITLTFGVNYLLRPLSSGHRSNTPSATFCGTRSSYYDTKRIWHYKLTSILFGELCPAMSENWTFTSALFLVAWAATRSDISTSWKTSADVSLTCFTTTLTF